MLNSRLDMKDMGLVDVILGIKISRTSEGIVLSQSHYMDKILDKFNKDDSGMARTPIDTSQRLSKNRGESIFQVGYSRIIRSLMYLMSCARPDIAYIVSKLSRYTSILGVDHWKEKIRILRYLRYTCDYGLHYTRYPTVIEGYSDANWISDIKDSKSTSGFVFTLGALDKCGEEAEWLRHFLEDIPRWSKPVPAIYIHCDSQSTIGSAHSNMYNENQKSLRRARNRETLLKPLSPQANGQVEAVNKTIKYTFKRKLEASKRAWVDELPHVLWAIRTTVKTPTEETPFSMAYGSEAMSPVKIGIPSPGRVMFNEHINDDLLRTSLDLLSEKRDDS
ncbi:cysteine-rich RLK (RECEPTOR-like protein kinase) 8 [Abeliophyllum distichum]|uniref:Cysteine-rich RLK (RECEPTOR-like protein kinase) 8 n=1 Tax=Abeliophyllum distichum TaxID=126358 RepID=A0ABD1RCZ7_9LAMI